MFAVKQFLRSYWWHVALAGCLILLHASHPLDSDEGVTLNAARRIMNGDVLYRDYFEFVGPVAPYFIAAIWKACGVSYFAAKASCIALLFAAGLCLEYLARQLNAGRSAKIAAFIFAAATFFSPVVNHNVVVAALAIFSVTTLIYYFKNHSYIVLATSGLLAGLTALTVQNRGGAIIIGIGLIIAWANRKKDGLKAIALWGAFVCLPFVLALAIWPAGLLWQDLIIFPWQHYPQTNMVAGAAIGVTAAISVLIFVALRFFNKRPLLYYLGLIQIFLLLSVLSRADLSHLCLVIFPVYVCVASLLENFRTSKLLYCLLIGTLLIGGLPLLLVSVERFGQHPPTALYQAAKKYCGGSGLYAGPFLPGLYFEFNKTPPTPYSFLITNHQTTAQFEEAARLLQENPPSCAFLDYTMTEKFRHSIDNPVDAFLEASYLRVDSFGDLDIYAYKGNK